MKGDVLDAQQLEFAMTGHDVVYANLTGRLEDQVRLIVQTMEKLSNKRLIFISSMGIYGEVPGKGGNSALVPYRTSVEIITTLEELGIGFVPIRPLGKGLSHRQDGREHTLR